jgi:DNA primase
MKTYQDIKSAATIDAMSSTMLKRCWVSFHARQKIGTAPHARSTRHQGQFHGVCQQNDEVRFHCFGACKGDWDIYDLIMLRKKYPFRKAQQVWAAHLGVADFKFDDGSSPCIPEPDETPEPDEPVGFVEPKKIDESWLPPWRMPPTSTMTC